AGRWPGDSRPLPRCTILQLARDRCESERPGDRKAGVRKPGPPPCPSGPPPRPPRRPGPGPAPGRIRCDRGLPCFNPPPSTPEQEKAVAEQIELTDDM